MAGRGGNGGRAGNGGVDKRRLILDAASRVFARRGFHACRVSDVADEAGVAYGLVYHYFRSKEEILNTLFLERWQIMLDAIVSSFSRAPTSRLSISRMVSSMTSQRSRNSVSSTSSLDWK